MWLHEGKWWRLVLLGAGEALGDDRGMVMMSSRAEVLLI